MIYASVFFFGWKLGSLWKEKDGTFGTNVCWYVIPEETNAGRREHNLKRELFKTNHFQDIEVFFPIDTWLFLSNATLSGLILKVYFRWNLSSDIAML